MLFQKARRFFIVIHHIILLSFVFHTSVFSEVFNVESTFQTPETLLITNRDTNRGKVHSRLEEDMQWLFSKVPYINIKINHDSSLGTGVGIEKFQPNFSEMDDKQYSYMLHYTLSETSTSYRISYIIFDSLYQDAILANSHTFKKDVFEKSIANIASDIYLKITGEFGFFIGKILYTERSKQTGTQVLYSQDINYNKKKYTEEDSLITSPTYCNSGNKVFFSKKQKYTMNLQEMNTDTLFSRTLELPKEFLDLNISSPEVSHDCKQILMSVSNGKQAAIYSFQNSKMQKIVKDGNINIRPIFGKNDSIYYISNRYNTPKIFSISTNGETNIISRGLGSYISFSISPNFKKIAFVKIFNGNFYLGVMNIDGSSEILLKTAYIIEAPSWAPVGNNIIVAMQKGSKPTRRIYSVSTITSLAYPLWDIKGEIVQANFIVNNQDTFTQQYH